MKKTALIAFAVLALAGCRGSDDQAEYDNAANVVDDNVIEALPVEPPPAPPTLNISNEAAAEIVAPRPPVPDDEQMQEDADATGMTARVDRSNGANETAPVAEE